MFRKITSPAILVALALSLAACAVGEGNRSVPCEGLGVDAKYLKGLDCVKTQ